jgi:hypothetical protein
MTEETWRPLGIETEEEIAQYDALHDGVPYWMRSAFWEWVKSSITRFRRFTDRLGQYSAVDEDLAEAMCQQLRLPLPPIRRDSEEWRFAPRAVGEAQLNETMKTLMAAPNPLQVADYILAYREGVDTGRLAALLDRSKSAFEIGVRAGKIGLVRRVPLGVQRAADSVMGRAGRAGIRLAQAWQELYGIDPNPSEAYRLAIQSVEDAAVPVVSPKNARATLGTVIADIESQANWKLPMIQEHASAPTSEVLVGMMRALWNGQHDRHGGQPSAPGNVSEEEAKVAVGLAVVLVDWFSAGLVARR